MSDELVEIGYVIKTHGVKVICASLLMKILKSFRYRKLFIFSEGCEAPIFINEIEYFKSGDASVKLEELMNKEEAEFYTKKEVFGPKSYVISENEEDDSIYIDYRIIDELIGEIGTVKGYIDMGDYELAEVEFNGRDLMIPLHNDIILEKDDDKKILHVRLPDGLIDL